MSTPPPSLAGLIFVSTRTRPFFEKIQDDGDDDGGKGAADADADGDEAEEYPVRAWLNRTFPRFFEGHEEEETKFGETFNKVMPRVFHESDDDDDDD